MANSKASRAGSRPKNGAPGAKTGTKPRVNAQRSGRPARTATEVIAEASRPKQNLLFCIPAFIIPFLLTLVAYICFGVYPFGDRSCLTLDLNGQYVYYFEAMRKAFWGDGSMLYNWSRNLSGGYMGIIGYYLASPFTLIVMLLPRKMLVESIMIMQMCKVGSCGATFCLYAQRSKRVAPIPSVMFSTMYAMMAFVVIQLIDPMWIDGPVFLPLIILGVEYLIDDGRKANLIIPLAIMFVANFYIGFMIAIFVGIYFFYYLFFGTERKFKNATQYCYTFATMGLAVAVALMLSLFMILPVYNSLALGKFDFSKPDYSYKNLFAPLELIPCMLPDQYYSVNVDYETRLYGRPEIYCGVMCFIMLPLYFLNNRIKLNKKIGNGLVLFILLISMYAKPVNMLWHGGQDPNWLPHRFSFLFSFVVVSMAAETFSKLDGYKLSGKEAYIATVLFAALTLPFMDDSRIIKPIFYYSLVIALVSIWLLSLAAKTCFGREITYVEKSVCFLIAFVYMCNMTQPSDNSKFYIINAAVPLVLEIVTVYSFVRICRDSRKKATGAQYAALAGIAVVFAAVCVVGAGLLINSGAINDIAEKISKSSNGLKTIDDPKTPEDYNLKASLELLQSDIWDVFVYFLYFPIVLSSALLAMLSFNIARKNDNDERITKLGGKLIVTELVAMIGLFMLELAYWTITPLTKLTDKLFGFSILNYNEDKYQYPAVKPYKDTMEYRSDTWDELWLGTMYFGAFLAAVYLVYLFAYSRVKKKPQKTLITCIVAAVVCFETGYNCYDSFRKIFKEVGNSDKVSYTEIVYGTDVVDKLEEIDGGFYRSEKTYSRMVNDNSALGLKGVSHSSSVMNARAIKFLESMGYYTQSFESKYEGSNPIADSILGIKYVLHDPDRINSASKLLDSTYQAIDSAQYKRDGVDGYEKDSTAYIYKNPNALNIGYMVDDDVINKLGTLGTDNPIMSVNHLLSAMTGNTELTDGKLYPKYYYVPLECEVAYDPNRVYYHEYLHDPDQDGIGVPHDCYEAYPDAGDAVVNVHMTVPQDGEIYMHLGSDVRKECNVWVSDTKDENGNFFGHDGYGTYFKICTPIVRIGPFKAGTEIEVRFTILAEGENGRYTGANEYLMVRKGSGFNFYYLDKEAFENDVNLIKQNQWEIDTEKSTDRKLVGTITANEGQIMMTSIPYEPGWSIEVDGEKYDNLVTEETDSDGTTVLRNKDGNGQVVIVNSLIGIRLPAGEHTVKMTYTPPGFNLGIVTFFIGLACLILLYMYDRKHNSVLKARRLEKEKRKNGIVDEPKDLSKKGKVQIIKSKGAVDGDVSETAKKKAKQARDEAEKAKAKDEELLEKGKAYAEKAKDEASEKASEAAASTADALDSETVKADPEETPEEAGKAESADSAEKPEAPAKKPASNGSKKKKKKKK